MPALAFVSPEGRVLADEPKATPTAPAPDIEPSLDQLAAMAARKQSTKTKQTE